MCLRSMRRWAGRWGTPGELTGSGQLWRVVNTQKAGNAWLHFLADKDAPAVGAEVRISVDRQRRDAIQRHHTVTHLLHWALHEVVSTDASQKGSYVGPDKLTFDFSSAALTPQQVADVERLVNERILENAPVSWVEAKYSHVKDRKEIMQFFRRKIRGLGARGADRRQPNLARRLLDGVVRRNPCARHGRDRFVPDRGGIRYRRGHPANRGGFRHGSLPASESRFAFDPDAGGQGEFLPRANWRRNSSPCWPSKKTSRNNLRLCSKSRLPRPPGRSSPKLGPKGRSRDHGEPGGGGRGLPAIDRRRVERAIQGSRGFGEARRTGRYRSWQQFHRN